MNSQLNVTRKRALRGVFALLALIVLTNLFAVYAAQRLRLRRFRRCAARTKIRRSVLDSYRLKDLHLLIPGDFRGVRDTELC